MTLGKLGAALALAVSTSAFAQTTPGTLPVRRYCTSCSRFHAPMPLVGSEVMLNAVQPASVEPAR